MPNGHLSALLLTGSLLLPLTGAAQKVGKTLAVPMKPRTPDCVMDSAFRFTKRVEQRASAVLTFCRQHDTGYYRENTEVAAVVWQLDGHSYARLFRSCRPGTVPAATLPLDTLFTFYQQRRLAELTSFVMLPSAPMSGPAYQVDVSLNTSAQGPHGEGFLVRAPARHAPAYQPKPLKSGQPAPLDPRSQWLDLLEKVIPEMAPAAARP